VELIQHYASPLGYFGATGALVVSRYRGNADLPLLDALDALQTELIQRYPKISTLSVITTSEGLLDFDEAVRSRSAEFERKYAKHVLGSAVAVTAKGLSAVMVRSFLSAFFLVARNGMPLKTFRTVAESLAWLQSLEGQEATVREVALEDVERFLSLP
jgi:hypothetical protein